MTSPELLCRGLRPLTLLGLVHILATPSPLSFGDGPYPPPPPSFSDWSTMQACRTDPLAQSHRFLSFLKYTLDASGQLNTLAKKKRKKKKQAPVFIIRNICVVIPFAVIPLSTGNRISHLLCRVSSPLASQDIYCHCHNDLIEAKEPFVGLKLFALQMMAPVQGWLHLTAILKALFSSVILVNVKWIWH